MMKNIIDVKSLAIFLCVALGLGYLISVFSDFTFVNASLTVGVSFLINGMIIFLLDWMKRDT